MTSDGAEPGDGKLDLVPLIDTVMLLLMFFILTSKFTADDLVVSSLLPPEGQAVTPTPDVLPPETIRIVVLPDGPAAARVRIGGGDEVRLAGDHLALPPGPELQRSLDAFHAELAARLAPYEHPGARADQPPVEIHCASRLPWRFALATYDAVRAYELGRLPDPALPLEQQRAIAFAPPAVRATASDTPERELERLQRLR